MSPRLRLDSDGIGAVLNSSEVQGLVGSLAESIAASVRTSTSADVVVDRYTATGGRLRGERGAASVTIRNVRGRLWEVRDGVLTRAAASAGLQVVRK